MSNVFDQPTTLASECALYAYALSEPEFDELALGLYFASGKFDRWTLQNWEASFRGSLKLQNLRAAIDNTIVFLPTSGGADVTLAGSLMLIGFTGGMNVVAVGVVAAEPMPAPESYRLLKNEDGEDGSRGAHMLPVHVLGVCGPTRFGGAWSGWTEQHPDLPRHVRLCVEDLREAYGEHDDHDDHGDTTDTTDATEMDEITRQRAFAAKFVGFIDEIIHDHRTPVPDLEALRVHRLGLVRGHVTASAGPPPTLPPPARPLVTKKRKVQTVEHVMNEHARHAKRYARL